MLGNLVGRAAGHEPPGCPERGIPGPEVGEYRRNLLTRPLDGLADDDPALELQDASPGIAAQLVAPGNPRRVNRRNPDPGVRRARLQRPAERLEPHQHSAHPRDGILPLRGTAPVSDAPLDGHLDPREPLVGDGDRQAGRLGHHRRVRVPRTHQRLGPEAGAFFVDHRRHDQAAGRQAAGRRELPRRVDHRGQAALGVLRAPSVQPSVPLHRIERPGHPLDADRIQVPAEHEGAAGPPALEHTDDVRPPGGDLLPRDVEPGRAHRGRHGVRDRPLATRSRHQVRVDRVDRDEIAEQSGGGIHGWHDSGGRGGPRRHTHEDPTALALGVECGLVGAERLFGQVVAGSGVRPRAAPAADRLVAADAALAAERRRVAQRLEHLDSGARCRRTAPGARCRR